MIHNECYGVPRFVTGLSDFDRYAVDLGKNLIEIVAQSSDEFEIPFCAQDEVEAHLYPPHAQRIGRTCTIAARFDGMPINNDSKLSIVHRPALRPWGKVTLLSSTFISSAMLGASGKVACITSTVSVKPTRLAGQPSLCIGPVKTVSPLIVSDAVEHQAYLDRMSIPYRQPIAW